MKLLHNFPPRLRDKRNRAGAVTCRLLLSQSLSCWLAEGKGGRREGLEGKAVLFGQSAGTFTSCQQELLARRAGAAFPASSHNQAAKYLSAVLRHRHHQNSMCVWRKGSCSQLVREEAHLPRLRLHSSLGFPLS